MSGFDFRDMLGGADAKVGVSADEAQRLSVGNLEASIAVASALGDICDPDPDLMPHLVLGGVMSLLCSATRQQIGDQGVLIMLTAWRRLIDRMENAARG